MNRAFILGALLFLMTLSIDVWVLVSGASAMGVLLAVGTILVFATAIIWLIYHDDRRLHFRRGWVVLPLGIFGYAITKTLEKGPAKVLSSPENLMDTGNLIMTRFQLGLWIESLVLLLSFVLAGSLMRRKRAR